MKNMKIRDTKKRTDNRRIREGDYAKPGVTIQGEWTTFTFDAEKEDSCFVVLKDIQTQKEEKINTTHMKSMRRTENIMFHFAMVKKSTRIWK